MTNYQELITKNPDLVTRHNPFLLELRQAVGELLIRDGKLSTTEGMPTIQFVINEKTHETRNRISHSEFPIVANGKILNFGDQPVQSFDSIDVHPLAVAPLSQRDEDRLSFARLFRELGTSLATLQPLYERVIFDNVASRAVEILMAVSVNESPSTDFVNIAIKNALRASKQSSKVN